MSETIIEKEVTNGLPFSYANRFGVVLSEDSESSKVRCKNQLPFKVLAELHRVARNEIVIEYMEDAEFDDFISSAYSRDSSEAKQIVEDLGEELDLILLPNLRRFA